MSETSISKQTVSWGADRCIRDMYTLGTLQRHMLKDLLYNSANRKPHAICSFAEKKEAAMLVPSAAISGWLIWG